MKEALRGSDSFLVWILVTSFENRGNVFFLKFYIPQDNTHKKAANNWNSKKSGQVRFRSSAKKNAPYLSVTY